LGEWNELLCGSESDDEARRKRARIIFGGMILTVDPPSFLVKDLKDYCGDDDCCTFNQSRLFGNQPDYLIILFMNVSITLLSTPHITNIPT
jgi:hypothetical protein